MRIIAAITLAGVLLPGALPAQTAPARKPPTAREQAAAAASAEPPAAPPASTTTSSYKISPGDQLEVYVWGDERLQRTIAVLPDGTFALPLAGTINANGKTPNQVETELSHLLAPQYKGVPPQVTVSVKQTSGMQVSVIGKVKAPGSFFAEPLRHAARHPGALRRADRFRGRQQYRDPAA